MSMRKMPSESALRSRVGIPSTDRHYDEIVSRVLWRVFKDSLNGHAPDEPAEARLNMHIRNSRIEVSRQDKHLEFQDELIEPVPANPDATAHDILDVIQKRASTRQQMVFAMLVEGMTLQEIADHLGVAVGAISAEKLRIRMLLQTELELNID